jgi:hypothetical protein
MDDKERVLDKYPEATCQPIYSEGKIDYYCVYLHRSKEVLGSGDTEELAWEDAFLTVLVTGHNNE